MDDGSGDAVDTDVIAAGVRLHRFSFRGEVSLGNLLIIIGMLGTGAVGIYTVGTSVQRVEDALTLEIETRGHEFTALGVKLDDLKSQQQRDVITLGAAVSELRTDVRAMLTTNYRHQR